MASLNDIETKMQNIVDVLECRSVSTITGTLPMIFRADGTALINYRIYGTPDGAGVQTENLYDMTATDTSKGYVNNSVIYTNGRVAGSTTLWCVSEYLDINDCTKLLLRMTSDKTGTAVDTAIVFYDGNKARISGVNYNARQVNNIIIEFNVPEGAYFVRFSAFKGNNTTVELLKNTTQQTALTSYIPYGYQIPFTVSQQGQPDKTVDIYIGDTKLLSTDYIDYESGKIVRNGTLQDPPKPFPEINTYIGINTLDSVETLGEVTIKGKIKEVI